MGRDERKWLEKGRSGKRRSWKEGRKSRRLGERASEDRLRKGEKTSGVKNKEREVERERTME